MFNPKDRPVLTTANGLAALLGLAATMDHSLTAGLVVYAIMAAIICMVWAAMRGITQ